MSNVHALPGLTNPTDTEPVSELVAIIRDLLTMAEDGRLRSFIGTGFMQDGARIASWCDTHPNVYEMMGAIRWLEAEYVDRHTSVDEE